jgi:hypothetical protein
LEASSASLKLGGAPVSLAHSESKRFIDTEANESGWRNRRLGSHQQESGPTDFARSRRRAAKT